MTPIGEREEAAEAPSTRVGGRNESEHRSAASAGEPVLPQAFEENALFLVAVAAIIRRGDRILAMRRSEHKDAGAGLWETLSGRVRHGEDPYDAVRREIEEECGLEVEVDPRPIDCYRALRRDVPMVLVVYGASWVSGEVRLSDEHDDFRWSTPEEFGVLSTLTRLVESVRRFAGIR